jgi:hypothetical protein
MILESPTNPTVTQEVDPTSHAARVSLRPLEHDYGGRLLGHYRLAARSGVLTGTGIVAGAPLFSFRWTDATALAILTRLEARYVPTAAFTAAQELGLDAILASAWSAADSSGTAVLPGTGGRMRRSGMGTSLVGDVRIAGTTLLTAGTRTLDAQPIAVGGGLVNDVNDAAETEYVNPSGPYGFVLEANPARGEHPIVLAANEGLIVRNTVVFPAAGTATLLVSLAWAEVAAY